MAKKKESPIINTLVLVVISVIAVALLALVNQITMGPIADAEASSQAESYLAIYPDCEKFAVIENLDELIANSESLLAERDLAGCTITDAMECLNKDGNVEGYVVAATTNSGYGGDVSVAIGIKDGKLTGFNVLSHSESPGFGANATELEFTDQFKDKAASLLSFTKTGAQSDTEIDAISGATITTKAVTQAVNAAILFYQESFAGGAQEAVAADYTEFYQKIYPNAEFTDVEGSDDMIAKSADLFAQYGFENIAVEDIKSANNGEGYVICVTGKGYSEFKIAAAIKGDEFIGFTAVECMETPGYGAPLGEDEFAKQFAGMKVDAFTYKVGATGDNEIDAIAGATKTSSGVTNAMNAIVVFYQQNIIGEVTAQVTADVVASATA